MNQNLFGSAKDTQSIEMIKEFEPLALQCDPRGYCVCTSEGKDSTVLGHLYRRAGVKHFYARSITGIDPPELFYFAREQMQKRRDEGYIYHELPYEKSMWKLMMEKLIPPIRQMRYCCEALKESRRDETYGAVMSFGVRKAESVKRSKNRNELEIIANGRRGRNIILPYDNDENRQTFENCYVDCEKRLNPIAYWDDTDIWDYIHESKLDYCLLYDEGFPRLGCIGCPNASEYRRKIEFARWAKFKDMYIRAFVRMYAERVRRGLPVRQSSGQEWFEWWISDAAQEHVDENQFELGG